MSKGNVSSRPPKPGQKPPAPWKWFIPILGVVVLVLLVVVASSQGKEAAPDNGPSVAPSPIVGEPKETVCDNLSPNELPAKRSHAAPFPMSIDPKATYDVQITTSCGTMLIRMLPKQAPTEVNNFLNLVEEKFYLGMVFYGVDAERGLLLTGDPTCPMSNDLCGLEGPGYELPASKSNGLTPKVGSVAMGLGADGKTAGSRFIIVANEDGVSNLDPSQTIFGELVGSHSRRVAQLILTTPTKLPPGAPAGSPETYPDGEYVYLEELKIIKH